MVLARESLIKICRVHVGIITADYKVLGFFAYGPSGLREWILPWKRAEHKQIMARLSRPARVRRLRLVKK